MTSVNILTQSLSRATSFKVNRFHAIEFYVGRLLGLKFKSCYNSCNQTLSNSLLQNETESAQSA